MPDVIGGVAEIPDACLGDVMTAFYQENGNMNQMISRRLEMESPLIRLGNSTKTQFPAQMGDIYTKIVLTATRPTPAVGKNWTQLKAAYPGGPVPTCRTPELVRYGHMKTSACLERFSLRTDDFNAVDLTFKTRREQQWGFLINTILPDWSMATQKYWYREAFRKNVWNVVLTENGWRSNARIGEFVTWTKPTSVLTPDYLDEIYRWLAGYGANQTPYTVLGDGQIFHVLITGPDEARLLDELDRASNAGIGSRWNNMIVIPGYGSIRTIRNWVIMTEDDITRLGENEDGTYFEVPATIEVNVAEGTESVANPDYYNPGVAKYTAHYFWNAAATEWFMPPDFTQFPNQVAGNWNGTFSIINLRTPEDPKGENAYFLADFAFGMGPRIEPRRAAVVLSLAVHRRGRDICPDYGTVLTTTAPTLYAVKNFAVDSYTGRLLFEANVAIPSSCPAQYALYLVTQGGLRAKIETVVGRDESGAIKLYSVALEDSEAAVVRTCDPWVYVACLPNQEPTTATVSTDCLTCGGATPVCDFTGTLETVLLTNLRLKDGTQLNDEASGFNFPYDVSDSGERTQLDTDLTTYLDTHGGGSVTVGYTDGVLTLTIAGTEACLAQLVGDAGSLNFVKSNCVAAEE